MQIVRFGAATFGAALAFVAMEEVAAADTIDGTPSSDILIGTDGPDTIDGGAGDDRLLGGDGDDVLLGGEGDDYLSEYTTDFEESDGDDLLDGGPGDDFLEGSIGNDVVVGGSGNDELYGDPGDDLLDGGEGDDQVQGEEGHDVVIGGPGIDILAGDEPSEGADSNRPGGHDVVCGDALDTEVLGGQGVDLPCGVAPSALDASDGAPVSGMIVIERQLDDDGFVDEVEFPGLVEGPISYVVVFAPSKGSLVIDQATGAFTYTPFAGATGTDAFEIALSRLVGTGDLRGSSMAPVFEALGARAEAPATAFPDHLVFDGTDTYIQWSTGLVIVFLEPPVPVAPAEPPPAMAPVVPISAVPAVVLTAGDARLPTTGAASGPLGALGAALVALGTALHLTGRRHQPKHLR